MTQTEFSLIDTADIVHHVPSGETWVVAYVRSDRLAWCGWPQGEALLTDCTLIQKASPEARLTLLQEMAAMQSNDARQRYAVRRLAQEENDQQTPRSPQKVRQ